MTEVKAVTGFLLVSSSRVYACARTRARWVLYSAVTPVTSVIATFLSPPSAAFVSFVSMTGLSRVLSSQRIWGALPLAQCFSCHRSHFLDAKTGALQWTTYTVPAPGEPGSETWPNVLKAHVRIDDRTKSSAISLLPPPTNDRPQFGCLLSSRAA
jgi:hypothetical protein